MCYIDDIERCEFWNEDHRQARKEHRCSCCCGVIAVGQMYLVHFSKFQGVVTTGKMCGVCEIDRQAFANEHGGILFDPGHFPEMLAECIAENDEEDRRWLPMQDRIRTSRKRWREAKANGAGR